MRKKFLVVARHGRTLLPGHPSVFVGRREDVSLTDAGEQDARQLGEGLGRLAWGWAEIRHAKLQRAAQTAYRAQESCPALMQAPSSTDARLDEIDYGRWTGHSASELSLGADAEDLRRWQKLGQFPVSGTFSPSYRELEVAWRGMLDEAFQKLDAADRADASLFVTHSGQLRVLAALIGNPGAKMACGHFGVLTRSRIGYQMAAWDLDPSAQTGAAAAWPHIC